MLALLICKLASICKYSPEYDLKPFKNAFYFHLKYYTFLLSTWIQVSFSLFFFYYDHYLKKEIIIKPQTIKEQNKKFAWGY